MLKVLIYNKLSDISIFPYATLELCSSVCGPGLRQPQIGGGGDGEGNADMGMVYAQCGHPHLNLVHGYFSTVCALKTRGSDS